MTVKLLTEHHLEFLSLKGGSTGLSESTLVKMPHCWKSHVMAQLPQSLCWPVMRQQTSQFSKNMTCTDNIYFTDIFCISEIE